MGKTFEPIHSWETGRIRDVAELKDDIVNTVFGIFGPDCAFKHHNTYACYKKYSDIWNLPLILE